MRTLDPRFFLRGLATRPRLPADACLPKDVCDAAGLPIGLRLELLASEAVVEIDYTAGTVDALANPHDELDGFAAWIDGRQLSRAAAHPGSGSVRLDIGGANKEEGTVVITVPERMRPYVTGLRCLVGDVRPTLVGPRWVA